MGSNLPLSDQYAQEGERWADLNAAASLLEETKSSVLSQLMMQQGDVSVARAEMLVKSSSAWKDHVQKMVVARKQANLAKVRMEYLRMKFWEMSSQQATERLQSRI